MINIDRKISNYLKAIAIIFVIFFDHIFGGTFSLITSVPFGAGAVNIFLILSGYGLYVSYCSKGLNVKSYWSKKIDTIFIPYTIITVIYFVYLRFIGTNVSFYILLKNILCIDFQRHIDGTMWYMSFLLIWYMVFFFVFYFGFPKIFKILIMFFGGCVFHQYIFNNIFDVCSWQFSVNAFAFPTGILIGYVFEILNKLTKIIDINKYVKFIKTY